MPPTIPTLRPWSRALAGALLLSLVGRAAAAPSDGGDAVVPLPALATAGRVDPSADAPPLSLRIGWGGGRARRWDGTIRFLGPTDDPVGPVGWRLLSTDRMAATRVHADDRRIAIRQPADVPAEEIEVRVADDPTLRVVVRLQPDGRDTEAVDLECTVGDLLVGAVNRPLDGDGNRLTVRRAPGDEIRVAVEGGSIRSPGDTLRLHLHPLLPPRDGSGASHEIRVRVREGGDGADTYVHSWLLREAGPRTGERPDMAPQRFEPIAVDVPLPPREGAFDIALEVSERGGLRWARPLVSRVVQVVAVGATPPRPPGEDEWRVVWELDPTSPKLMERLRRLPVVGRGAAGSLPHVPLPMVSLPKVPLPSVPLPTVPIPAVPMPKLPSVGAVVPRLSGLLPSGHSMLESHPAGAAFRLPPARSDQEPTWEAVHLSGAVAGAPHRLEIALPSSDRAVVSVTVLEQVGNAVIATFQGGFDVEAEGRGGAFAVHACTFWPQTRNPLVVIGNPSLRRPLVFGAVRVLAGPAHLRPASIASAAAGRRCVWGVVDDPALDGFGGPFRVDPSSGRVLSDWRTVLTAARTSAEWFAAQGVAGALVTVHADGAPAWPSATAAESARWQVGADAAALDTSPKDVVEVLCRVYARHGLGLIPAIRCAGPLPSLEATLASGGGGAAGILCVGRDGRPPRTDPLEQAPRYNILDPRVQAALEAIVAELAARVDRHGAVDGIALLLPHDGWFHLPGVAWGLDDATFARFVAAIPAAAITDTPADETRFARRAALVEGPLAEPWLSWRAAEVAAFVARLRSRVAGTVPARTLSIVPTTLFAEGELAARFRPSLAGTPPPPGACRQIGLDPALLAARSGVVWVSPHVHTPADDLVEAETVRSANRSAEIGAVGAGRRATIAIEIPGRVDLGGVLAQAPFTGTATSGVARVHAARTGASRDRMLAEVLAAGECERVYDRSLATRVVDRADLARVRTLRTLPAARLSDVPGVPSPLVVRAGGDGEGGVTLVTNAAPVRCRVFIGVGGIATGDRPAAATTDSSAGDGLSIDLAPWETRSLGGVDAEAWRGARVAFDHGFAETVAADLERLRRRRVALELPAPMPVLDNPGFEHPDHGGGVPGWELLEPRRGSLRIVPGAPAGAGRALSFGSENGLATLRSNPFPPPRTGRISVALWLRVEEGAPAPPLRIALEGVDRGREYYRFAAVGGDPGSRRPSAAWGQYVLAIEDLPTSGLETLRVRLDLLAGGAIQLDDVRVFDLAFDESERVRLSEALDRTGDHLRDGDLGACAIELDSHWARFLDAFVSDDAAARAAQARLAAGAPAGAVRAGGSSTPPAGSTPGGILDRVRRWWK